MWIRCAIDCKNNDCSYVWQQWFIFDIQITVHVLNMYSECTVMRSLFSMIWSFNVPNKTITQTIYYIYIFYDKFLYLHVVVSAIATTQAVIDIYSFWEYTGHVPLSLANNICLLVKFSLPFSQMKNEPRSIISKFFCITWNANFPTKRDVNY